jgi:hypothetical protein
MIDKNKSTQNIANNEYKNCLICPNCYKNDVKLCGFSKDVLSKPYYIFIQCSCTNSVIQCELSYYINNILNNDNEQKMKCGHPNEKNEFFCESCKYKMCQKCQENHILNYPTHKCKFINDKENILSYCKIHKANHSQYCNDCKIGSCFKCYLNNHLMHNIVAKDKYYASIKEIIPFKSLEKLNEYFESELKESSIFNDEIINKLDKMIKGLINIKNSFIETKNYKYENESKKIIIANVIYKSFYNEKNETSIASILNMEKLILNSLIFKEDKIHFGNILNECFKSLVEIGKSCNRLINRTLVSFKKNNIQEEKLIIKSTNTNGAMDSNPIITNDEIFYNSSNLTEKNNNLEDNSSFKNSKIASILSNIKDSSMSEGFVSNQNNTIIELNENNYNEEKMSQSKKVKSPKTKRRKIKDKSKSNIFVIKIDNKDNKKIRKFENIQNVYINYKNNIQENKDHFVFDRKTIDELLKSSMTSLEYDNYLMKDDRKPNLNAENIVDFKLGDVRQNKLFQKRNKDILSNVYNNDNNIDNINNSHYFGHNLNESMEKGLNSSFENDIFEPNDNKSFGFDNSFI